MNVPVRPASDDHQLHDRLLVARAAGDELDPSERPAAQALLASCGECRMLQADLRALSEAVVTSLPTPRRSRDFRLSAEDAARLRPSGLEGWLGRLARPGFALLQPVAGAAIAIGMLLVVLGSLPFGAASGAGGARPASDTAEAPAGEPMPALPAGGGGAAGVAATAPAQPELQAEPGASPSGMLRAQPGATPGSAVGGQPGATPGTEAGGQAGPTHERQAGGQADQELRTTEPPAGSRGPGVLSPAVIGIVLMALGLLLLVARWAARRRIEYGAPR